MQSQHHKPRLTFCIHAPPHARPHTCSTGPQRHNSTTARHGRCPLSRHPRTSLRDLLLPLPRAVPRRAAPRSTSLVQPRVVCRVAPRPHRVPPWRASGLSTSKGAAEPGTVRGARAAVGDTAGEPAAREGAWVRRAQRAAPLCGKQAGRGAGVLETRARRRPRRQAVGIPRRSCSPPRSEGEWTGRATSSARRLGRSSGAGASAVSRSTSRAPTKPAAGRSTREARLRPAGSPRERQGSRQSRWRPSTLSTRVIAHARCRLLLWLQSRSRMAPYSYSNLSVAARVSWIPAHSALQQWLEAESARSRREVTRLPRNPTRRVNPLAG